MHQTKSHKTPDDQTRPRDEVDKTRTGSAEPHATEGLGGQSAALEENVRAIVKWEQSALHGRSRAEQLSDWITAAAASGPVLVAHLAWFALWAVANAGLIPGVATFDPFPFPLLTMTVSLEAIFLALFVLASQNRLALQADKRAHLDLQIDLLAEREMTVVLRLLQDIVKHLGVKSSVTTDQIRDLLKMTDIHELTKKVDELPAAEAVKGPPQSG